MTIFRYVVFAPAELKHTDAGVINCVVEPLVITSARTPEPATGSVVSFLDESAVLLPVSLYNVTHAACDVSILSRAYVFGVVIEMFAMPFAAILFVADTVVLDAPEVTLVNPDPSP